VLEMEGRRVGAVKVDLIADPAAVSHNAADSSGKREA
jgi:hypothetical protein